MKLFYTLFITVTTLTQTLSQESDYKLIEETINSYFDGMVNHNSKSFSIAFQENATMKWIGEDYTEVNAIKALSDYVNSNKTVKTKTKIITIRVEGEIASAQLELEYENFYFIDYMQMVKIKGIWKIVSKAYTKKPKEFQK